MSIKNPYTRLLNEIRVFCLSLRRREKQVFTIPKAKMAEGWRVDNIWERTVAAEQLGWNVEVKATEAGLVFWYVKKPPAIPYNFQ